MAVTIPLVLVLWEDRHYGGTKRVFVTEDDNLASDQARPCVDFNDKASAVGVHPGPDFASSPGVTVSLFSDAGFQGDELVLAEGAYPDLKDANFNDRVSSVRFNGPGYPRGPGLYVRGVPQLKVMAPGPAAPIAPIPVVVQLYTSHNIQTGGPGSPVIHSAHVVTLVESSLDIGAEYGSQFSGSAVAAKIVAGPNPSATAVLYRETNPDRPNGHMQGGGHIDLAPTQAPLDPGNETGAYDLANFGFAHQVKAVRIDFLPPMAGLGSQFHHGP